jgi:RNA polymerase sigma-70 factor (ECF subfamily)
VPLLDPDSLPAHLDRLYRAAWALSGSRQDAEDLVQETCVRVLARPRQLRNEDEIAYLMRVLRNTFLSTKRTASRRPSVITTPVEDLALPDSGTAFKPDAAYEATEVYATIAALPEDFRLALVAVDIVGLSYREAAKVLATKEATITTRLYRARRQVARALSSNAAKIDD